MASFFRRLLGGHEPPPPELADATRRLDELVNTRPALCGPATALRDVLTGLLAEPIEPVSIALSADAAHAKLASGVPLLHGEPAPGDPQRLRKSWLTVCAALEKQHGRATVQPLQQAVQGGKLDPHRLLGHVFGGEPDAVDVELGQLGLDATLARSILRFAALPILASAAAALEPLRNTAWDHGYCPICGSWPVLGEYRGLEQTRFLRCGLCAASWEFSRMRCPFCDERDHRRLGYFHADGEQERWRAATCDSCRGYVKMVASLDALSWPLLLVQDVATLHLDLAAADRGFMVR